MAAGLRCVKGADVDTATLAEQTTANEVREALTNISHTLTVLRAVGADTEGVMRYADRILDRV
jgi:hypothetical protein